MDTSKTARNQLPAIFGRVSRLAGWERDTVNLDIGSGPYNKLTEALKEQGVTNLPYDPYALSLLTNLSNIREASKGVDTVTLSNVLNVLQTETQMLGVLRLAREYVKDNGTVYIAVWPGNGTGIAGKTRDGYQQNKRLKQYLAIVRMVFSAETSGGMIIAKKYA
jgi:hypothetical protein